MPKRKAQGKAKAGDGSAAKSSKAHCIVQLPMSKEDMSAVQLDRLDFAPPLPAAMADLSTNIAVLDATQCANAADAPRVAEALPETNGQPLLELCGAGKGAAAASSDGLRVGVAFCGRQASGGHNAVIGLLQALNKLGKKNTLLGFVGGTLGLFAQDAVELSEADGRTMLFANQGGYDLLGRTVDKIKGEEHVAKVRAACDALKLDGLVLIGGERTATHAAFLAEAFAAAPTASGTAVVVVPASIDGAFKNEFVETSIGFDTACRVYSHLIGNLQTDALSNKKYWYFLRLMGNERSHINLECALQTRPNVSILGEEVIARHQTLADITSYICDIIAARAADGKNYGVVLLPEGLIGAVPEVNALIVELNELIRAGVVGEAALRAKLSPWAAALFDFMPGFIREQMVLERESAGSVQLSQIETERLILHLVQDELKRRQHKAAFSGICSFFGYQARCSMPSNFDASLAATLGHAAAVLVAQRRNGYLATASNLRAEEGPSAWRVVGAPLSAMFSASVSPVTGGLALGVQPTAVDLHSPAMLALQKDRAVWAVQDFYTNPGPIQFSGPAAGTTTKTLQLAVGGDYAGRIAFLRESLAAVNERCRPGCSDAVLKAAAASMSTLTEVLELISAAEEKSS